MDNGEGDQTTLKEQVIEGKTSIQELLRVCK